MRLRPNLSPKRKMQFVVAPFCTLLGSAYLLIFWHDHGTSTPLLLGCAIGVVFVVSLWVAVLSGLRGRSGKQRAREAVAAGDEFPKSPVGSRVIAAAVAIGIGTTGVIGLLGGGEALVVGICSVLFAGAGPISWIIAAKAD